MNLVMCENFCLLNLFVNNTLDFIPFAGVIYSFPKCTHNLSHEEALMTKSLSRRDFLKVSAMGAVGENAVKGI